MILRQYVISIGRKRLCRVRYLALYLLIASLFVTIINWNNDERVPLMDLDEWAQYSGEDKNYFYQTSNQLHEDINGANVSILSTHYDNRSLNTEPFVRLLLTTNSKLDPVFCCYHGNDHVFWACSKRPTRPRVLSSRDSNHSNNKMHVYQIMFPCKLHESGFDRKTITQVILIVIRDHKAFRISEPSEIVRDRGRNVNKTRFTVCLLPRDKIGEDMPSRQDLMEYIELLQLLGASHVLSYYKSVVIDSIFKSIQGISVDYVQFGWNFTRYPVAARNDCIYRTMYSTKYVITLRANEILVPNVATDWHHVIETLIDIHNTSRMAAYIMQVYDFYDETTNGTGTLTVPILSRNKNKLTRNHNSLVKSLPLVVRFRTRGNATSSDTIILGEPSKIDHVTGTGSVKMLPGYLNVNVPVEYAAVHRLIYSHRQLKGLVVDASKDKYVPVLIRRLYMTGVDNR